MQQMKEITQSISSTTVTHEKISYNITGKHKTSKHHVFHLSKLQGLSWLQKSFTSLSPSKYSRQEPQSKLRKSFIICLTCNKCGAFMILQISDFNFRNATRKTYNYLSFTVAPGVQISRSRSWSRRWNRWAPWQSPIRTWSLGIMWSLTVHAPKL